MFKLHLKIIKFTFFILLIAIIFADSAFTVSINNLSIRHPIEELKIGNEKIGRVIYYDLKETKVADITTQLILVILDTSKTNLKILSTNKTVHMKEYFGKKACPDAILVISGGFFNGGQEDGNPSPRGLIITEGKIHSGLYPWDTGGVFQVSDNRYWIEPIRDFKLSKHIKEAIQSNTIIIKDGLNDILSDDGKRWDRMSIGTAGKDQIVFIGAFSKQRQSISLYNFATISLYAAELANIKLKDLLNLDGAGAACLNLRQFKLHFGYDKYKYVPNVFCIIPKN